MRARGCGAAAMLLLSSLLLAHQAPAPSSQQETSTAKKQATVPANPETSAWELLDTATHSDKSGSRALAVRALGLMPGNARARRMAEKALTDDKPEVRTAAAVALGEMKARQSIAKLKEALDDKEPAVALAAAHSLETMHEESGYQVYYEVLTGERKASKGAMSSQAAMLKDPKKVAELGFEQGIGFIPFAGIGWEAFRMLSKDNATPVRAEAAKVLANDPDPAGGEALGQAATDDKNWVVRVSAICAIAKRGDPSLIRPAELAMSDDKEAVRYAAAATVLHLLDTRRGSASHKKKE